MYNGDESEFYQQWKDIKRPIAYQWCRPSWQLRRQYDVVVGCVRWQRYTRRAAMLG